MNNQKEAIQALIEEYKRVIHEGTAEDFLAILSAENRCTLISIATLYDGRETIANEFLGKMRDLYTEIELISESLDINQVDEDTAVVIFGYHTECQRRNTGEPYGIKGLETQVLKKEDDSWKIVHVHYSKVVD